MITAAIAAVALMGAPSEKWDLKPQFSPDTSTAYKVTMNALVMGTEEHTVSFTLTSTIKDKVDDHVRTKVVWSKVELDGGQAGNDSPETVYKMNSRGAVLSAENGLEDDYRRMMTPFYFVYPDAPVGVGDKWEVKFGPKDSYTINFEVKGTETIAGEETLKIAETINEKDGMTGKGTWWVNQKGTPVKFEVQLKDWVAPFAGPEKVDVTIKAHQGLI